MSQPSGTSGKRRLLCEGWAEEHVNPATGLLVESEDGGEATSETSAQVWLPSLGYVTQGEKVCVLFGESDELDESVVEERELIESIEKFDELEERQTPDGRTVKVPKAARWVVEGPAQRSDVKNANQRTYPRSLWEKLIADPQSYVQEAIRERAMVGHLEHPKDGRTDLKEAAILTVSANLQEDGTVWNAFELLDTTRGRELQALTAAGVRWGTSSRGTGTVKDNGVVNESDYTLKCWDAVAAPSTPGAFVKETTKAKRKPRLESEGLTKEEHERAELVLSETTSDTLDTLGELAETDIDGLDLADRVKLSERLLRQLAVIVEADDVSALVLGEEPAWMTVKNAVDTLRTLHSSGGISIDRAIDEALEHGGEEPSDESGWNEIVEALQEQVSSSTGEVTELLERLEVAESRFVTLNEQHEEAMEQLSEVREELARARAERDLAYELLATDSSDKGGSGRVDEEIVEELVSKTPGMGRYRELIEQASDETQARAFVERLIPIATPRAPREPEVRRAASRASRSTLPVGLVESYDGGPDYSKQMREENKSRGASMAAKVVGAMQKIRN